MKRYPWSCLACGAGNGASASVCLRCNCPAQATYKQIELHRQRLIESGEKLEPSAARLQEPGDLEIAARVLLIPLGLILGLWPSSKKNKK